MTLLVDLVAEGCMKRTFRLRYKSLAGDHQREPMGNIVAVQFCPSHPISLLQARHVRPSGSEYMYVVQLAFIRYSVKDFAYRAGNRFLNSQQVNDFRVAPLCSDQTQQLSCVYTHCVSEGFTIGKRKTLGGLLYSIRVSVAWLPLSTQERIKFRYGDNAHISIVRS